MHPSVARALRDTVNFIYDTPVEVALKYNGLGKPCQTPSGMTRYLFTLTDGPPGSGRVMFLDEPEARFVAEHFAAGDCFWICKRRGIGKKAPARWEMWVGDRSGPMEQSLEPEASRLERDLARSIDRVNGGSVHGALAVPRETRGADIPAAPHFEESGGAVRPTQPAPAMHKEGQPVPTALGKPAQETTQIHGTPSSPWLPPLVEVVRSFSYKLNAGNYESRDFFASQKAECRLEDADVVSDQLYHFCKRQVMRAVEQYRAEQRGAA